jgi:hypothetical protein
MQINGTYELNANLQTDIWNKNYTLINETRFNTTYFILTIPINHTAYEEIINNINEEIDANSRESKLNLTLDVSLTAKNSDQIIIETFNPEWSLTLEEPIIEIIGESPQTEEKFLTSTISVVQNDVLNQRYYGLILSIFLIGIIILFALLTKSRKETLDKTEQQFNKIIKKYGEWIVNVEKIPDTKKMKSILVKSLDDLIKISEDLGKPLLHIQNPSKESGNHTFYLIDDSKYYKYKLKKEKINKIAECPQCKNKIEINAYPNEIVDIKCPYCNETGTIKI